ncbi:hypothetical protein E2C01_075524 [Portunus trituberculatus]|uniref:Uncharacterized protein n=1 Tax=Portunus trituberculatus TaxID=210409 RepID=A0A5B7IG14_PORTR|nr:hypothetical protein [Portunus trituberculatus]
MCLISRRGSVRGVRMEHRAISSGNLRNLSRENEEDRRGRELRKAGSKTGWLAGRRVGEEGVRAGWAGRQPHASLPWSKPKTPLVNIIDA